jgi:hypothetical protein
VVAGGAAWFLSVYVGPIVSLLRSPFGWRSTATIGILYLVLLLATAHVTGQALMLQRSIAGVSMASPPTLLDELAQPLRW